MPWRAATAAFIAFCACQPQVLDAISGERGLAGTAGAAPTAGSNGTGAGAGTSSGGEGGEAGSGAMSGGAGAAPSDAGAGGGTGEPALRGDALIHRYSFDGTGTQVWDSKGGAHGTLVNTELDDSGVLELAGLDTDQHVDLPDGLVSGLSNATFEIWLTWHGGNNWQRAFDFGSNFLAGDGNYAGARYLFLTPSSGIQTLRAAISMTGVDGEVMLDADPVVTEQLTQLVVVVDDRNDIFALYRNGELESSTTLDLTLADLNDVNNWLGRSQFEIDAELDAALHDFRIYDVALNADEIRLSFDAGPLAALEP